MLYLAIGTIVLFTVGFGVVRLQIGMRERR
jgi:hypothetical protein